ncbi:MAG: hypothetical protein ACLUO4_05970 [Christensenellales bacterium]
MKRRIGIMMLACMVVFSLYMPTAKMGPEIGEEVECIDGGGYTFETILSGNQKTIGRVTSIGGYYRLYDDGMALYYSREDYIYDTKENAVWLPERKDFSLKAMVQKELKYKGIYENKQTISPLVIINELRGKNGYAATATYIDWQDGENDPVYQNAKWEKARKYVRYDREEVKKDPIKVSFYRLAGDPWQFDGKKIQVECISGDFICAAEELLEGGGLRIGEIYSYQLDGKQVWKKIAKKYDPDGDKNYRYVQATAYDGKYRVEITGMFYLYWLETEYWIEDEAERGPWFKKCRFELVDMEVNEKDRENFQKDMNEYKQSVMENKKAYEN